MKKHKTKIFFSIIFVFFGIAVFTGALLLTAHQVVNPKPHVSYHGPNPNILLTQEVLARTSSSKNTLRPTTSPTSSPKSTEAPTPANKFGVSSGALVSMSQKELNAFFSELKTLGITYVRWDIDWGTVQHTNVNTFDWSSIDRIANTAKSYGLENLGIIDYAPNWASGGCDEECTPTDAKAFGVFAGAVAKRYQGTISIFEIWNEPNTSLKIKPYVDTYINLLKESYTQIKAANPQATVITGGLAPSADESDGNTAPITFIKALYANGANKYFDAVGFHPYSFPATPNYRATWNAWQQMSTLRQIMVQGGDSSKKIWVTEYGAPTNGDGRSVVANDVSHFNFGSDFMNEAAQAQMMKEMGDFYTKNTSWMGPLFWYSLKDLGTDKSTPENFFGIVRFDGSKKPAYAILQGIISK